MDMAESKSAFVQTLWRQAALMEELSLQEEALQQAVQERQWERLQETMKLMTQKSEELTGVENERIAAYEELMNALGRSDKNDGDAFSDVMAHLPEEIRGEISEAYRALKVAVLQLKSRTGGIDTYLRSTISTMRGVMRELYPEHTTPVYSRTGTRSYTGGQALMVDHHL